MGTEYSLRGTVSRVTSLSGKSSGAASLSATMDEVEKLSGQTEKKESLSGDTNEESSLNGNINYGDKGDPGDSAYQIAVKNGFEGTEAEWLSSLKGKDGSTPFIQDGYWYIDGKNTYVKAEGADGESYTITDADKRTITETVEREIEIWRYQPKEDKGLGTQSKTLVGAINELHNNLVSGYTWQINDVITSGFEYNFKFKSNGRIYDKMRFYEVSDIERGYYLLVYEEYNSFEQIAVYEYYSGSGECYWKDEAYKKVFTEDDISLDNIASKVTTSITDGLKTEAKSIVGAINEINSKVGSGGGSSTVSLIGTWTVIDEPEIPTSDLPLEFTSNGVKYSAIVVTSQGSSSWGINALSYFRTNEGYYDAAYVNNPSGNYGISHGWRGDGYRYLTVTKEPTDKNTIKWLGKNTDAPIDTEETSNGFEMPQIRFTSATGSTENDTPMLYVDADNPLKLTVEIVGGGALQAGDQLQVCIRKRFSGSAANGFKRKYKLQRFAEYVVTEDDLDKKYLTVSVACEYCHTNKMIHHSFRGLFRDGMAGGIAPLYLRIRRPKGVVQNNGSGQSVDADFSNIVTIWKHSIRGMQSIRIQ